MPGIQKNIRLSSRALELLRALKYVLNAGDSTVIEAALTGAATQYLLGCAQRLLLATKGLVPEEEVSRIRTEAAVLIAALNTGAGPGGPLYRLEGNQIERQQPDGS